MVIQKQPFRERVEVPNFEANVYRLNTSATGPLDNLQEILPVYFYRGVACKYFGEYWTRTRVVHLVGFWGVPKI